MNNSKLGIGFAVAGLVAIGTAPALAIDDIYVVGDLRVNLGIEVGIGGFYVENPNFGLGRIDLRSGQNTGDAAWGEGYFEPSLSATYGPEGGFNLFGAVSAILPAVTAGDGDAGGFTDGNDADAGIEKGYLGFRIPIEGLGENPWTLEVSGGKQDVQIGDGWLFWDGNFDSGDDTAFWLAPRTAFNWAATADVSNGTFGLKPFFVEGDNDNDHARVAGLDLRFEGDWGKLGALYGNVFNADEQVFVRDGMQMVSLRALGIAIPGIEGLSVSGEATKQFGDKNGNDFDGTGYYGQADYTLAELPWSPTLTYRYAWFSGDGDVTDSRIDGFDPLFYGFSSGWGTWFQGEIVGEYLLFNSNQRNHMVKLALAPMESLGVGVIYYRFSLDENNYFGTPVSDRHFADEVNFFADWTISDNVFLSGVASVAVPGSGAKQAFGDDQTIYGLEAYMVITF